MGNTLLTGHIGLLNEHCTGCKIMNQKRPNLNHDMNRSFVTSRILVLKYTFMFLLGNISQYFLAGKCSFQILRFTSQKFRSSRFIY